ncbi:MAG: helix-turn-helix transcriptional regulator, partial [Vicinamibacterales bacterium]
SERSVGASHERSYDLVLTKTMARCVLTCRRRPSKAVNQGPHSVERDLEGSMSRLPSRINSAARVDSLRNADAGAPPLPTAKTGAALLPARIVPVRLLRFPVVRDRTGLSRSTIWRLERRGEFPKHYRIAPNVVAWSEQEVSHWIEERLGAAAS